MGRNLTCCSSSCKRRSATDQRPENTVIRVLHKAAEAVWTLTKGPETHQRVFLSWWHPTPKDCATILPKLPLVPQWSLLPHTDGKIMNWKICRKIDGGPSSQSKQSQRICFHTDPVRFRGSCNLCCTFQQDAGLSVCSSQVVLNDLGRSIQWKSVFMSCCGECSHSCNQSTAFSYCRLF